MMLDHPGMVVAAAVGGLELRQRILIELELVAGFPRARQLQLIEDAEFHDVSPATRLVVLCSVFSSGAESSLGEFRLTETSLAPTRTAYHQGSPWLRR